MMKYDCRVIVLILVCTTFVRAERFDWPQFRGADRNAVSKEPGLLQEWPKGGPPVAWKAAGLGGGFSAPAIANGKVFGMGYLGDDEVVWALNESDGKLLWTARLGDALPQKASQAKEGPGGTPTVDGDKLYVEGMAGDISCVQVADGKVLWQRSMKNDFGAKAPTWSFRESLLVDGDNVLCTPGGPDATLVALDKLTGKTVWRAKVPGNPGAAYASPIAIEVQGQRQYVQFTARALIGVSPEGKLLWKYDKAASKGGINCATPVYGDGLIFASAAYNHGGAAAKLIKNADGTFTAEEVYFTKQMQNHHGGMVLFDGCLYGASGGNEGGSLVCLDFKTGKVLWDGRNDSERSLAKGSLALAGGRIYYRTEAGDVLLIEPSAKEYIERGRFKEPNRSRAPAWAHPVIANGKLYLRDQDNLTCFDIKAR